MSVLNPSLDPDPPREWVSLAEVIGVDPGATTAEQDANVLLSRGRVYLAGVLSVLIDNTAQCG